MTYRNRRLLDLARGQPCAACGIEDGTTVAAHSNLIEHGRGYAHKASDAMSMHLCYRCHVKLDAGGMDRDAQREFQYRMILRTYQRLWEQELIRVA